MAAGYPSYTTPSASSSSPTYASTVPVSGTPPMAMPDEKRKKSIEQYYQDYLGRSGSPDEIYDWYAQSQKDTDQIGREIWGSPEAYGKQNPPKTGVNDSSSGINISNGLPPNAGASTAAAPATASGGGSTGSYTGGAAGLDTYVQSQFAGLQPTAENVGTLYDRLKAAGINVVRPTGPDGQQRIDKLEFPDYGFGYDLGRFDGDGRWWGLQKYQIGAGGGTDAAAGGASGVSAPSVPGLSGSGTPGSGGTPSALIQSWLATPTGTAGSPDNPLNSWLSSQAAPSAPPTPGSVQTLTQADPNEAAIRDLLMQRATQSITPSASDPIIAGQTNDYRAEQQREATNYLRGVAEKEGPYGNLRSEGRMAAENVGQNTSQFVATLLQQERDARREEQAAAFPQLTQMGQFDRNLDSTEKQFVSSQQQQESQFSRNLQLQQLQVQIQNDQFGRSLNQQDKQYLMSILQQQDQFTKDLQLRQLAMQIQNNQFGQSLNQQDKQFLMSLGFQQDQLAENARQANNSLGFLIGSTEADQVNTNTQ